MVNYNDTIATIKMKFILFIFITFGAAFHSYSQGLFFDNLEDSQWVSTEFDQVKSFEQKNIGLYKLRIDIDLIKDTVFIWTFKKNLEITYFDPATKIETEIVQLEYVVIEEKVKNYLRIYTNKVKDDYIDFHVGIISTGSFVNLYKKKK